MVHALDKRLLLLILWCDKGDTLSISPLDYLPLHGWLSPINPLSFCVVIDCPGHQPNIIVANVARGQLAEQIISLFYSILFERFIFDVIWEEIGGEKYGCSVCSFACVVLIDRGPIMPHRTQKSDLLPIRSMACVMGIRQQWNGKSKICYNIIDSEKIEDNNRETWGRKHENICREHQKKAKKAMIEDEKTKATGIREERLCVHKYDRNQEENNIFIPKSVFFCFSTVKIFTESRCTQE